MAFYSRQPGGQPACFCRYDPLLFEFLKGDHRVVKIQRFFIYKTIG